MQTFARFVAANSRWLAGGLLLAFFSSFGQTFFIALSGGEIRRTFELTNGEFGSLYMAATLLSAATLPFLGRLLDRYSVPVVSIGTMLMLAAATVAFGLAWSVPTFLLAIYMLRLFGQGMMTEVALTAIGRWFAANRGRAVSITTMGNRVGEGVYPLLFVLVAPQIGWRGTWLVCAGVILLVALPAIWALVRVERSPHGDAPQQGQPAIRDWTRPEVLRDPKFYVICAGALAPAFIGTTVFFHQAYLAELRGWSLGTFGAAFMLMSAITVVVGLLAGVLIDRFSAVRLLPVFLVPLSLSCFSAAWIEQEIGVFVFMAFMGVSYGFSSTISGAIWPELYGTRHLGAIRSVVISTMVLATAMGPGITGLLIDAGVPFSLQLAGMGAYSLGASIVMLLLARRLSAERACGEVPV